MKISKQADNLYNTIQSLCEKMNSYTNEGYIILDEKNDVIKGKFVFEGILSAEKGIYLQHSKNISSFFIVYGECCGYGENTFYQECRKCYNDISKYRLVNPKDAKSITEL